MSSLQLEIVLHPKRTVAKVTIPWELEMRSNGLAWSICGHAAYSGFRMRQVWPICGDGIDLEIRHTLAGSAESKQLMWRTIAPDPKDKPQRQKVRGTIRVTEFALF